MGQEYLGVFEVAVGDSIDTRMDDCFVGLVSQTEYFDELSLHFAATISIFPSLCLELVWFVSH